MPILEPIGVLFANTEDSQLYFYEKEKNQLIAQPIEFFKTHHIRLNTKNLEIPAFGGACCALEARLNWELFTSKFSYLIQNFSGKYMELTVWNTPAVFQLTDYTFYKLKEFKDKFSDEDKLWITLTFGVNWNE